MKKVIKFLIIFIFLISITNVVLQRCKCKEMKLNTLYVGGNDIGNYSYIQDAINSSSDGDTIFVYSGIYNETIFINKSINLIGENKETTILNGNNNSDYVILLFYNVNLTGFTIQDGCIYGIKIEGSGSCNIFGNYINKNPIGIYIGDSFVGGSYNSNIFNNTISNSSLIGLDIEGLSEDYIDIFSSLNNTIFHNNFINNMQHTKDVSENFWSYKNEGNYYDDYKEPDKNNDGIGDKPYKIPGGKSEDRYPLMMPYNGTIRLKKYYVDYDLVFNMLIIGLIISIIFVLPIAYYWRKKYFL